MSRIHSWPIGVLCLIGAAALGQGPEGSVGPGGSGQAQGVTAPKQQGLVKVTIHEDQASLAEPVLPVDPVARLRFFPANLAVRVTTEQGQPLHLSHFPLLHVDGQAFQPGQRPGGSYRRINAPLGPGPGGKPRQGYTTTFVQEDLHIIMEAELVPTKGVKGAKTRRRDAMLIRYTVENKGSQAHKFGLKVYIDTFVINTDGPLFAAPTMPGKVLDGLVLKGKTLPDYVQILQQPNLQNPGFVAHLTLHLGRPFEKPDRVVLTRHGAGGFAGWDLPAMQAMGDSALGIFWEPVEIKAGARREFAYGYGQGIVVAPENEGRVELAFGGSFEPGKLFTLAATVHDPLEGQTLQLQLPPGLERLEGKEIQPVPTPAVDNPQSLVLWKCRVIRLGAFPIVIRSSNGVTKTLTVNIEKAGERK